MKPVSCLISVFNSIIVMSVCKSGSLVLSRREMNFFNSFRHQSSCNQRNAADGTVLIKSNYMPARRKLRLQSQKPFVLEIIRNISRDIKIIPINDAYWIPIVIKVLLIEQHIFNLRNINIIIMNFNRDAILSLRNYFVIFQLNTQFNHLQSFIFTYDKLKIYIRTFILMNFWSHFHQYNHTTNYLLLRPLLYPYMVITNAKETSGRFWRII